MRKYVIFDMDGTLADASARQHHLQKDPKDWDSFFNDLHADSVIQPIAELYNILCKNNDYDVAIFTGRPESSRSKTEIWMKKNGLALRPIYFRKDGDQRHDLIVKQEIYENFTSNGKKIAFIVEDRNSVVKMWRDLGITCLHCADADF